MITEVHSLIEKQFIKNNVEFVVENVDQSFKVVNLKNEFKQVCLNILNNANDALASSETEKREIRVSYEQIDGCGKIIFRDNAGGIQPYLLPDGIFEPYVTTKGDKGSGIGLYVCKDIVVEHMGGDISAHNVTGGAEFVVILPIADDEANQRS